MVTYFIVGLVASLLFDYRHLYTETELRHLMRPLTSPWVALGPPLQCIRGTLLAVVLWPLREALIERPGGGLRLFGLFVGLAILGPAGPAPGSLEGVMFTTLPWSIHLVGLPEVIVQTAVFSAVLVHWCGAPARWKNVVAAIALVLIALMGAAGAISAINAT
jgi:hypothetical protein